MARSRLALAAAVAGATVVADQLSKAAVRAGEDRLPLLLADDFGLSVTYNSGVSFGRFQGGGAAIVAVVTLLVVVLVVLVARLPRRYTVPLALIVGGAIGNLIDRIRWGSVLDFVAAGPWPTFNVADVAIVAGAVLVAWRTLRVPAPKADA